MRYDVGKWRSFLITLAVMAAGIAAVQLGWLDVVADGDLFRHELMAGHLINVLLISGAGVLFTALGGPRQLLAFAGGFAIGPAWGTVYSTLITLIGAVSCFYAARYFLRPTLARRAGQRLESFDQLTRESPFIKVMMIRLLPVGSNLLTNLFAGSASIALRPFVLASGLGYLPQMLVFALMGAGFGQASEWQLAAAMMMLVVAAVLGFVLYRNRRNRQLSVIINHQAPQTDA